MESMVDIGLITGSGIYDFPGAQEPRVLRNRFGEAEVMVFRVGLWTVGGISRHGKDHYHLPNTVPHQANLAALGQLGARAILATTTVGTVDPAVRLGQTVIFDELFFPDNRLPNGETCTLFTEPEDPERGHLVSGEPFSPHLRRKIELAARELEVQVAVGGVYAHTNGPRFETSAEIKALAAARVTAVSQTCGPEAILAGELGIPYALVGFPVNHATGTGPPEPKEELDRLLALSAEVLPRLALRTIEALKGKDLAFDHGYVYRVQDGIGQGETKA